MEIIDFVQKYTTDNFRAFVVNKFNSEFVDYIDTMVSHCHNNFSEDKKRYNALTNYSDFYKFLFGNKKETLQILENGYPTKTKKRAADIWKSVDGLMFIRIIRMILFVNRHNLDGTVFNYLSIVNYLDEEQLNTFLQGVFYKRFVTIGDIKFDTTNFKLFKD